MKNIKVILFLSVTLLGGLSLASCSSPKEDELIRNFYEYYNDKNYPKLSNIISDTIRLYEENDLVLEGKERFIDIVKWGAVFNSRNTLLSLRDDNGSWMVSETQSSDRILFLFGHDLRAETRFEIYKNKIVSIETQLIDFDTDKDTGKLNEFISWVEENHLDLMKNIWQLNSQGAKDFKKAMELYQNVKLKEE